VKIVVIGGSETLVPDAWGRRLAAMTATTVRPCGTGTRAAAQPGCTAAS
jgi:hypothetical protein